MSTTTQPTREATPREKFWQAYHGFQDGAGGHAINPDRHGRTDDQLKGIYDFYYAEGQRIRRETMTKAAKDFGYTVHEIKTQGNG